MLTILSNGSYLRNVTDSMKIESYHFGYGIIIRDNEGAFRDMAQSKQVGNHDSSIFHLWIISLRVILVDLTGKRDPLSVERQ